MPLRPHHPRTIPPARWPVIIAFGLGAAFGVIVGAGTAQPAECQLSLTLLVDSSASVKPEQRQVIREGTAWALTHPFIEPSIVGTGVVVRVVEYADRQHELVAPTMIGSREDLEAVAANVLAAPSPGIGHSTATGMALLNARETFRRLPCERNVVDVLTDGERSNSGVATEAARMEFDERSDQVNVLWVEGNVSRETAEAIQFGPLSFLIPLASLEDVGKAMLRKLSLEVSWGLSRRKDA